MDWQLFFQIILLMFSASLFVIAVINAVRGGKR